jgi:antitoxin (DNA-binding transcriptional repressor) of toxin-antitoxin stability system
MTTPTAGATAEPITVTELNQQTTAALRRVKAGHAIAITERGRIIAYLTPPPPTMTGNPTIDRWIAEGRLVPATVPGTILDLLPLPAASPSGPDGSERPDLAEVVIGERDRAAGQE